MDYRFTLQWQVKSMFSSLEAEIYFVFFIVSIQATLPSIILEGPHFGCQV